MIKIVSHTIPKNNVNNWSKECVAATWKRKHREPSITSSLGWCMFYENCSFKDTQIRWPNVDTFYPFLSFLSSGPRGPEPTCWVLQWVRGKAQPEGRHFASTTCNRPWAGICEVLLWPLRSHLPRCVWPTGGSRQHTCRQTCSEPLIRVLSKPTLNHWWGGVAMHGRAWKPKAAHQEQGRNSHWVCKDLLQTPLLRASPRCLCLTLVPHQGRPPFSPITRPHPHLQVMTTKSAECSCPPCLCSTGFKRTWTPGAKCVPLQQS